MRGSIESCRQTPMLRRLQGGGGDDDHHQERDLAGWGPDREPVRACDQQANSRQEGEQDSGEDDETEAVIVAPLIGGEGLPADEGGCPVVRRN